VKDARILVVDDDDQVARLASRILESGGYRVDRVGSAAAARAAIEETSYALLLCDMQMPGESGLELVRALQRVRTGIATIFVTGMDDRELANEAVALGAYGYMIKPFRSSELLINVANALRREDLEAESRFQRDRLEQAVRDRTRELEISQEETIGLLSGAAETRDSDTGYHIRRMGAYCGLLAQLAGLDARTCELIRLAAPLHDVGKIGVPDSVLLKPGALTVEERAEMDRHTLIGFELLRGSRSPLLELAATIALTHHERVDGTGKPYGLAGSEIPIEGRIAAVADVFDALTSNRVYRRAMPVGDAVTALRKAAGTHLDESLVELLAENLPAFAAVREGLIERSSDQESSRIAASSSA